MKKLTKFQRFLTGGHDEERADLAEYIRDNFEYDMLKSLGFTEI